ncbi:hypothetical protein BC834DRAFT_852552 [Gloeopeniophorella convolvens]|nr:hypothetical protein BC834DRAFT_852552 [Gloeopeniophorella convolvens]
MLAMAHEKFLHKYVTYFAELSETMLFGFFTALLLFLIYILIERGLRENNRRATLAIIILMWLFATVHWAAGTAITGNLDIRGGRVTPIDSMGKAKVITGGSDASGVLDSVSMVAVFLNLTLSDAIVMSRAWLLWGRSRVVLFVSLLLATLSFASIVLNFLSFAAHAMHIPVVGAVITGAVLQQDLSFVELGGLLAVVLSVVSNLWAFGLVAAKACKHRQFLKSQLHMKRRRTRVENVMTLLLESGAIYAMFWILLVIMRTIPDPLVVAAYSVLSESVCQISGIYPTIIIVLTSREMSTAADRVSTFAPRSVHPSGDLREPHSGEHKSQQRARTSDVSLITLMIMRDVDLSEQQGHAGTVDKTDTADV